MGQNGDRKRRKPEIGAADTFWGDVFAERLTTKGVSGYRHLGFYELCSQVFLANSRRLVLFCRHESSPPDSRLDPTGLFAHSFRVR